MIISALPFSCGHLRSRRWGVKEGREASRRRSLMPCAARRGAAAHTVWTAIDGLLAGCPRPSPPPRRRVYDARTIERAPGWQANVPSARTPPRVRCAYDRAGAWRLSPLPSPPPHSSRRPAVDRAGGGALATLATRDPKIHNAEDPIRPIGRRRPAQRAWLLPCRSKRRLRWLPFLHPSSRLHSSRSRHVQSARQAPRI